nr:transcriptional regulator, MerR family [uncultured bacterium]
MRTTFFVFLQFFSLKFNPKFIEIMSTTEAVFSKKDLGNLSSIKAHTVRTWEKRYNLLTPKHSNTNIRHYDLENLKKLLNISF